MAFIRPKDVLRSKYTMGLQSEHTRGRIVCIRRSIALNPDHTLHHSSIPKQLYWTVLSFLFQVSLVLIKFRSKFTINNRPAHSARHETNCLVCTVRWLLTISGSFRSDRDVWIFVRSKRVRVGDPRSELSNMVPILI